jgi:DNA mismatch repair ATPase MutL
MKAKARTYMLIEKGTLAEPKESVCPVGTSIAVFYLFYHIPTRRKHLRSNKAELAEIADRITEMAIHHQLRLILRAIRRPENDLSVHKISELGRCTLLEQEPFPWPIR